MLKYYIADGRRLNAGLPGNPDEWDELFGRKFNQPLSRTPRILDADIVVFTGGEDVSPALYGERADHRSQFSPGRDINDIIAYHFSGRAKLRVGVCRGAQFLNVMSGGKLWQHIDGDHGTDHKIVRYRPGNWMDPTDETSDGGEEYIVTSTHHQMMRPGPDALTIGVAVKPDWSSFSLCKRKHADGMSLIVPESGAYDETQEDVEVLWYPKTRSLCVQGHPEYDDASDEFVTDFETMITEALEACADT